MTEQDLEIIKSRPLFLKNGERSSEVVLVDPDGGDMFFTFELRYAEDKNKGKTRLRAIDAHHAEFIIDTLPEAITKPADFIEIGTYGVLNKPLYMGFVVQPQIAQSGEHNVIITFYTRKEVGDGAAPND